MPRKLGSPRRTHKSTGESLNQHHEPAQVHALYRAAAVCVVSSLHDGMNLVAKEFAATRDDLRGVLVLSQFTGASRELTGALLVNPYAVDEFAQTLDQALSMPLEEQAERMRQMRAQVKDNNIYRWAGMLLSEVGKHADARQLRRRSRNHEQMDSRRTGRGLSQSPRSGVAL